MEGGYIWVGFGHGMEIREELAVYGGIMGNELVMVVVEGLKRI